MDFNLFRRELSVTPKRSIWHSVFFAFIGLSLVVLLTFLALNPRIGCELTGGKWIPYSTNNIGYVNSEVVSDEETEFFGECHRTP